MVAHCTTCRHTPHGYVRSKYSTDEIDAIAAYAPETDHCYLLPAHVVGGHASLSLRVAPTRNNQALNIRWAKDYELERSLRRDWGVSMQSDEPLEGLSAER